MDLSVPWVRGYFLLKGKKSCQRDGIMYRRDRAQNLCLQTKMQGSRASIGRFSM